VHQQGGRRMTYWIVDRKDDMYRYIKECEKDNDCNICPYVDDCNDIAIALPFCGLSGVWVDDI